MPEIQKNIKEIIKMNVVILKKEKIMGHIADKDFISREVP